MIVSWSIGAATQGKSRVYWPEPVWNYNATVTVVAATPILIEAASYSVAGARAASSSVAGARAASYSMAGARAADGFPN